MMKKERQKEAEKRKKRKTLSVSGGRSTSPSTGRGGVEKTATKSHDGANINSRKGH